jgi:hypothetical protein
MIIPRRLQGKLEIRQTYRGQRKSWRSERDMTSVDAMCLWWDALSQVSSSVHVLVLVLLKAICMLRNWEKYV